jgi:hypothetical protein
VFCNFSYRKSLFRNEFENSKATGILERKTKKEGWNYSIKRKLNFLLCKYYVRAYGGVGRNISNFECNPSYFLRQFID